jgi:glycogen debranching enzyme
VNLRGMWHQAPRTSRATAILGPMADDVAGLHSVLSPEGWPYASALPVEPGDPGRFHALFGRDSLITSLQLLPVRPDIARATLRALADRQGRRTDPGTQEAPGKIGHEFRDAPPESFVAAGWPGAGAFSYFGTADATSWFLVVAGALGDPSVPGWSGAADWIAGELERGEGLLRHAPGTFAGGLMQQGWRDTIDGGHGGGISRPDGTPAEPPLADADTQAVTIAALRAAAKLSGDGAWARRAERMRAAVTAAFGPEVMALEGPAGVPVPGAGSQLGWLLWADALEPAAVDAVADRLCRPDVLTDHGLRTLSSDAPQFSPHAYHRGSVWPFDSWLGWGGLRAAGRHDAAERVRTGVLAALDRLGRFPELYAVTGDVEPVPISNQVQAWTVGARWALEHEWDGRA